MLFDTGAKFDPSQVEEVRGSRVGGRSLMAAGCLLIVIGVILLVVWVVTRTSRAGESPTQRSSDPTPNRVLRERFARGEITEQEFEQVKKALGPDRTA